MTNTLVTLLARHLRLNADSGACPDKTPDGLEEHPKFQQIGTVDKPHIKRIFALFIAARERAESSAASDSRQKKPDILLVTALLHLFERAVRLRFNISDRANLVIDRNWRVFYYSTPEEQEETCDGDCKNCNHNECEDRTDQQEDRHDCGPLCRSRGGPGCGRPDCTCKEPEEPVERTDIQVTMNQKTFSDLKAVGVCLASQLQNENQDGDHGEINVVFCINQPMYQAMKKAVIILTGLTSLCEKENGWNYQPEQD
jgi:hypothetical protein